MTLLTEGRASNSTADALARLLRGEPVADDELRRLYGFGGLHGGVLAALLLRAMGAHAVGAQRAIELNVHFAAATHALPDVGAAVLRSGRRSTLTTAEATVDGTLVATATAMFAEPRDGAVGAVITPGPPAGVSQRADSVPLAMPTEFVPIFAAMELRAATSELPFAGGSTPELAAWIRLKVEIDDPLQRLLVLVDGLAPSYAAVLAEPVAFPTVRLTVRFTPAATAATEWVLVRASTSEAGVDGWLTETLDIWSSDGAHLVSASQLRTSR